MIINFEDWLRDYWYEHESEGVLDDDCPEAEEDWIANLDPDDWIRLGQKFGEYVKKMEKDNG